MKPQGKWSLKNGKATLASPAFRLMVDAAHPEAGGLVQFAPYKPDEPSGTDNQDHAASLFQVHALPSPPTKDSSEESSGGSEPYCRGRDLITRYPASTADPIAREIYWRLEDPAGDDSPNHPPACVETIYSLQTDLLDSAPQPSVPSVFQGVSCRWFQAFEHSANEAGGVPSDWQWNECSWDDACFAAGEVEGRVACVIKFASGVSILQTVFPPDLRGVEVSVAGEQTEIHWQLRSDFLEKGVIRRLRMLTVMGDVDSKDQDLLDAACRFYASDLPLTV